MKTTDEVKIKRMLRGRKDFCESMSGEWCCCRKNGHKGKHYAWGIQRNKIFYIWKGDLDDKRN